MTAEQEKHLAEIKQRIANRIDAKYRRGQAEHGGNLWDRDTVKESGFEITDLITYMHCIENDFRTAQNAVITLRFMLQNGAKQKEMLDVIETLTKALHIP